MAKPRGIGFAHFGISNGAYPGQFFFRFYLLPFRSRPGLAGRAKAQYELLIRIQKSSPSGPSSCSCLPTGRRWGKTRLRGGTKFLCNSVPHIVTRPCRETTKSPHVRRPKFIDTGPFGGAGRLYTGSDLANLTYIRLAILPSSKISGRDYAITHAFSIRLCKSVQLTCLLALLR